LRAAVALSNSVTVIKSSELMSEPAARRLRAVHRARAVATRTIKAAVEQPRALAAVLARVVVLKAQARRADQSLVAVAALVLARVQAKEQARLEAASPAVAALVAAPRVAPVRATRPEEPDRVQPRALLPEELVRVQHQAMMASVLPAELVPVQRRAALPEELVRVQRQAMMASVLPAELVPVQRRATDPLHRADLQLRAAASKSEPITHEHATHELRIHSAFEAREATVLDLQAVDKSVVQ
jgi:hypothetical protein